MEDDPLKKIFDRVDRADIFDDDAAHLFGEQLLQRIFEELDRPRVSWIRRLIGRRAVVVSAVAVLALAGTAAAAVTLLRSPVQDSTRLSCFSKLSLTSDADVVGYDRNALATCRSLMHWPTIPNSPSPGGSLCVLSNGTLAGLPPSRHPHVCATLGLAAFNGHVANLKIAGFEESAQNYFSVHTCMTSVVARREVERLLKSSHVTGWTVRITGSTAPNACATLSIQVPRRLVNIVGYVF